MKRRNFFGKLVAAAAGLSVAPQALADLKAANKNMDQALEALHEPSNKGIEAELLEILFPDEITHGDLYIALFTTEPDTIEVYTEGSAIPYHVFAKPIQKEADYEGYSRVAVPRGSEHWEIDFDRGQGSNRKAIVFPECKGGWSRVTHIGISMEEDSDPIYQVPMAAMCYIQHGMTAEIPPGNLVAKGDKFSWPWSKIF